MNEGQNIVTFHVDSQNTKTELIMSSQIEKLFVILSKISTKKERKKKQRTKTKNHSKKK